MMYLHIDIFYKKDNNKAQQITQHKRFVAKGEKMVIRNIKFLLLFCIAVTLLIFCVACSQEGKAKRKFVSIIEKKLEAIQAEEVEKKEHPECKLRDINDMAVTFGVLLPLPPVVEEILKKSQYNTSYKECTGYEYNIEKTTSIVTPFIGQVTFICKHFKKEVPTMQECIDSEWKPYNAPKKSSGGIWGDSYNYAYQDGEWVQK